MIWLILPISLFWDLWQLRPLGSTGLVVVLGVLALNMVFWHGRKT